MSWLLNLIGSLIAAALAVAAVFAAWWVLWFFFTHEGQVHQCKLAMQRFVEVYEQVNGRDYSTDKAMRIELTCRESIINREYPT